MSLYTLYAFNKSTQLFSLIEILGLPVLDRINCINLSARASTISLPADSGGFTSAGPIVGELTAHSALLDL